MSSAGSAIRGSRVGAGPMGEADRGYKADRVLRDYFCSNGHETNKQFSAHLEAEEIMVEIDCPNCGLPAGLDKANPPVIAKHEPYKTHLAYVKERRTDAEGAKILEDALRKLRGDDID